MPTASRDGLQALTRQAERGVYTGPFGMVIYLTDGWTVHTPNGGDGFTLDTARYPDVTAGLLALDRFLAWLVVPSHTPHAKLAKTATGQHRYDPWDLTLTTHPHPAGSTFTGTAHGNGDEWPLSVPRLRGLRAVIKHVHEQAVEL